MKKFFASAVLLAIVMATPALACEQHSAMRKHGTAPVSISEKGTQDLQQALRDSGFYKQHVTGVWDQNTTNGVAAYQRANGLAVTGTLDKETVSRLGLIVSARAKAEAPGATTHHMSRHKAKATPKSGSKTGSKAESKKK